MTGRSDPLLVAIRAWAEPTASTTSGDGEQSGRTNRWRDAVLIVDVESTVDMAQRLTFGWYRINCWTREGRLRCQEEGIIYADDLPTRDPDGYRTLRDYVASHLPDTEGLRRTYALRLRSRREFVDDVFWPAIDADAHIVGFNLPFDLARLAVGCGDAKGRQRGGFSFVLWEHEDAQSGKRRPHPFRPRLTIKHLDNKRAFVALTGFRGYPSHIPKPSPAFLDLRTLAYTLTGRGHSLASAGQAFGVEQGKHDPGEHGRITPDYIAYARQDVRATAALLERLRAAYDAHPIDLPPDRAFSPASIAKAYLRAMGVQPRLEQQPDFPRWALGAAMVAYYGGRAECAIRRVPVPVVYTDVLSMYPTVNVLMKLWALHIAERVEVVECTDAAQTLLANITLDDVLDPARWSDFAFFAQIVPDGDVLPVRARYGDDGAWTIGVNPLTAERPSWYAGPDLVASVLLRGKVPRVRRAWTLVPMGRQPTLRPVALGGTVLVDPRDDFFRTIVEERARCKARGDPDAERAVTALKIMANAGCYGVFVEMNPEPLPDGETTDVAVWHGEDAPFPTRTRKPEHPGAYCFPPVAALITAGARLVLAAIERLVTDAGGTHAFCDTDSMAIVASEHGGLVPCPGGPHRLPDGHDAIMALSWADVDAIVERLAALNPYDRTVVPGSILKVEAVNVDPDHREQRQLWTVSIAAKRYALFTLDSTGAPTIVEGKRHGLGYLLDPREPEPVAGEPTAAQTAWETALWDGIVRERLGHPHDDPPWLDRPAVVRHAITSPWVLRPFATLNTGKAYQDRIKPFTFLLAAVPHPLAPLAHNGAGRLRLVHPFERDPARWTRTPWMDIHTGTHHSITTRPFDGTVRDAIPIQTLRDVANAYPYHPEPKRIGPDGQPCDRQTVGLLARRPVRASGVHCLGKEADRLDDWHLLTDWDDAIADYGPPPGQAAWDATVRPALVRLNVATLAARADLSARHVRNVLTGKGSANARRAVLMAAADLVREQNGTPTPPRSPQLRDTTPTDVATLATTTERRCHGCGTTLIGKRADARYCSDRCRKREKRHPPHPNTPQTVERSNGRTVRRRTPPAAASTRTATTPGAMPRTVPPSNRSLSSSRTATSATNRYRNR